MLAYFPRVRLHGQRPILLLRHACSPADAEELTAAMFAEIKLNPEEPFGGGALIAAAEPFPAGPLIPITCKAFI